MTRQIEYKRGASPLCWLVLAGLLAILLAANVAILNGDHAVLKHGTEASQIRKCLDNNGPNETWKLTSWRRPNHYVQTCKLDSGKWGIRIVQITKENGWIEKTAFVVKNGTKQELIEYVTARAIQVANAVPVW